MKKYIPSELEPKWQKKWDESNLYQTDLTKPNKFYVLAEFAYPSGDLHVGHWFTWAGADIYARFKRMQGYNVFFPNGFDSFGLPAEGAAIKRGIHPKDWTEANIEKMKEQYQTMGPSFDFYGDLASHKPNYYKWNQWIFLRMLEKGIVYQGKYLSNWCPIDQTVLANEAVEAGKCWRCGSEVIQKEINQWFFKITDYAEQLIWKDDGNGVDWPQAVMEGQNNWIGKSEGILLTFQAEDNKIEAEVEVFTTAIDTVFGVTFLVISPENQLLSKYVVPDKKYEVDVYIKASTKKSELERKENKEKSGVFTGSYVINPFNSEKVPVWVADYVLAGYGTGSVMGVPGHDSRDHEFADKFGLEIKPVIKPKEGVTSAKVAADGFWDYSEIKGEFSEKSVLFNSGDYDSLTAKEAKEKISKYIESNQLGSIKTQYHLHDWSVSRQRYWGTPVPIIHCDDCGNVPVSYEDLPVELPYEVDYTPKGEPPLASNKDWLNVKCPKCGGEAKRDAETMDTFVDSSWYFFRYLDPMLESAAFEPEVAREIMPVDIYFGGAEHTLGHTLYSRFFTKFFKELGMTKLDEYAKKRVNHGIVLGPDGQKMSKSRGNVINPDDEVKKFGGDAVRLHVAFFMPYDGVGPWISERIWGPFHFLERVWGLQEKLGSEAQKLGKEDLKIMHRTIKKVTEDISEVKFNTAIAGLMEWLNYLSKKKVVEIEEFKNFLLLLAPFAPHITEEIWQTLGVSKVRKVPKVPNGKEKDSVDTFDTSKPFDTFFDSIHQQSWPKFDNQYLEEEEVNIVVQINGKVRETLKIQKDIVSDSKVVEKMAIESLKVQRSLNGVSPKKIIYIPGKIISIVV